MSDRRVGPSSPEQEPAGPGQKCESSEVHYGFEDGEVEALVEHGIAGVATEQKCGDVFDGDQDGAERQHGESGEEASVSGGGGGSCLTERGL